MLYVFSSLSDTGRQRSNNEDAVACEASLGLAVLADGMGGYNAGEVASAMATGTVATALGTWLLAHQPKASSRETMLAMRLSVERANQTVYQAAQDNSEFAGMGTTLVVAVFDGARALVGHVGDSRCYRWRGDHLTRLTRDHSLLQEHIDAGLLDPADAHNAPYRNLVTRALGVENKVEVDITEHVVLPGDLFLMCSDGLTDMLADDMLAQLLRNVSPTDNLAQALIDAANEAGGKDNISVILVRATGGRSKRRLLPSWWAR